MQVRLRVPATTANLGPGFDALGLALDLWNEAVFDANEAPTDDSILVTVQGEGKARLPADRDNAIVRAALQALWAWSSCATGAPNRAITPSPVNWLRVPPYR